MEQISNEALWGKLSEIDKKLSNKTDVNQVPQLSIEPILDKLEQIELTLVKPSTHKHCHSIEIKSSKVFIALVSLSLFLLIAIILNVCQYRENNRLIDNDINTDSSKLPIKQTRSKYQNWKTYLKLIEMKKL